MYVVMEIWVKTNTIADCRINKVLKDNRCIVCVPQYSKIRKNDNVS